MSVKFESPADSWNVSEAEFELSVWKLVATVAINRVKPTSLFAAMYEITPLTTVRAALVTPREIEVVDPRFVNDKNPTSVVVMLAPELM